MNILFTIASIGFFLWIIRNILFWVKLWQGREYRLDRTIVQLRETAEGRRLFTSMISHVKWLLIFSYIVIIFNDRFTQVFQIGVTMVYLFEGFVVLRELSTYHQFKRPVRTIKAYLIIFLTLLLISTLYVLPMMDIFLWLLLLDRISVLVVSLFVFFFSFPTEIYTDIQIQKAKNKIKKYKNIFVIAVSGSYGKSSTKEYIAQLLSEKFNVIKTLGSNNTPIGIAKTILNKIDRKTDIFVVEMGAYKRGEIAELCDVVRPNMSVTTSVSDQHLSLYGSLNNAIDTEVELLQALPKDGIALFNGNNSYSADLYKKWKKKKVLYFVSDQSVTSVKKAAVYKKINMKDSKIHRQNDIQILASDVHVGRDDVVFSVSIGPEIWKLHTPLLGGHVIENLLPAIFIADHLGISKSSIKKKMLTLIPPPKTMSKKMLSNGAIGIDDTFNASPESVESVLRYMEVYKKRKILVLTPLIELGRNAKIRHMEIGEKIGRICNQVFLTNNNFYKDITSGIDKSGGNCIVRIAKPDVIVREILAIARKGDLVVFEGKEAAFVLYKLV